MNQSRSGRLLHPQMNRVPNRTEPSELSWCEGTQSSLSVALGTQQSLQCACVCVFVCTSPFRPAFLLVYSLLSLHDTQE